jgi:hypothetical protein
VPTARELLQRLQENICDVNDSESDPGSSLRMYFAEVNDLFHVQYYGTSWDEIYETFLRGICTPAIATNLVSLTLLGPDEGANGVRNWDLTGIVESDAHFPFLHSLFIEPTDPQHHNQSIVGPEYDEAGQIGHLLNKAPALKSLTVPSAPDASFFKVGFRPLRFLRVDTGFAHQEFLLNLSRSDTLSELTMLDFGDYNQRYRNDYQQECVPFEHYDQLFRSTAFQSIRRFNLRNSVLSRDQLTQLKSLRKDLQLYLIQAFGELLR